MVYMLVMLLLLSFIMFLIYNLMPNNRAYTEARNDVQSMKGKLPAKQQAEMFDKLYLEYQRRYGTDTDNLAVRYRTRVGDNPMYYRCLL